MPFIYNSHFDKIRGRDVFMRAQSGDTKAILFVYTASQKRFRTPVLSVFAVISGNVDLDLNLQT